MPRRRRLEPQSTLFTCRYCFDEDSPENLISPCICEGTMKYVHNRCLVRWYTMNPEIGLRCSICKTECAYQVDQPLEDPLSLEFIKRCGLEHPFLVTFSYHWLHMFYCLSVRKVENFSTMSDWYPYFQILFTGLYLGLFCIPVLRVRQKRIYMQKWFCTSRILLPIFHLYCIWLIPKYVWIGGVPANYCCFHYFYAHSHIIEEMNIKNTFRFITRRQERLPSSSEAS